MNSKKYQKGIIYKIVSKDSNDTNTYIGSTIRYIGRQEQHKEDCENKYSPGFNLKVYKHIRANKGFENWEFEIVEKYPCHSKKELHAREGYYQKLTESTLNSCIAGRTKYQWNLDNADKCKQYDLKRSTQKIVCDCGSTYSLKTKTVHFKTIKHQSYVQPDKFPTPPGVNCECGGSYIAQSRTRHFQTTKHKSYLMQKCETGGDKRALI
jgi:hypothetical protein